jgi:hypothetical protein
MLKQWHSTMFIHRFDKERFEAKQTYFEHASNFLHTHRFELHIDREVWALHAEGKSLREIAKLLSNDTFQLSKDGALKIIRKLQRKMRG